MNKPDISFTFPIRWINDPEDRKFLKKNLEKMIAGKAKLKAPHHPDLPFKQPMGTYKVRIRQHAWQPEKIKLTQKQLEKLLEDVYPGQKLIYFDTFFVQKNQRESLPTLEMQIFF